jgi:RAC serine/threonine-protein kinase
MDENVIKSGWLMKEGGGWKSWKRRWFCLKGGTIFYAKSDKDHQKGKDQGQINLEDATYIKPTNQRPKRSHCFEIPTPDRIYYISAATAQEMQDWISACRQAKQQEVEKNNPPPKVTANSDPKATNGTNTTNGTKEKERVGIEDFELLTVIGEGSFGKVLRVRKNDNGQIYAMKVLDKKMIIKRNELEHTRAEKSILQKLECPFLVKLHYTFQTTSKLYFILDYVNGGELFFHLQNQKKFDPERVKFYCAEIVLGLKYLHEKGILYRDLKPENVLLTSDGHICMTDFGISKEGLKAADDRTATFCGTPEYLAPEVLEGTEYGKAVDWWSFGTLMYEMLTGLPPFYSQDVQVMYQKIMTAKLVIPDNISPNAASLLKQLLERDPEKRLLEPKEIMSHPYFESVDWEKLNSKQITPPYVPQVTSADSIENIDTSFTSKKAEIEEDTNISNQDQQDFNGFTWQPTNNHLN